MTFILPAEVQEFSDNQRVFYSEDGIEDLGTVKQVLVKEYIYVVEWDSGETDAYNANQLEAV